MLGVVIHVVQCGGVWHAWCSDTCCAQCGGVWHAWCSDTCCAVWWGMACLV